MGHPENLYMRLCRFATSYREVSEKKRREIDRKTTRIAAKIKSNAGKVKPGFKTKAFFHLMRIMNKKGGLNPADREYYKRMGWI